MIINSLFKNIGIVVRPDTPEAIACLKILLDFLKENQIHSYLESESNPFTTEEHTCPIISKEDLGKKCDLILVLGGDGTFLSAARQVTPYRVPLIGINLGHLGFLARVSRENMIAELSGMLTGKYLSDECILLEASVKRENEEIFRDLALNDVMLSRGLAGKMIEFEVFINKEFVYRQRSDGLIISTPTGSTAYSLAAGGSILQTGLRAFTLVSVCPQSLTNRPIVVLDSCEIEILITKSGDARVHFDGQTFVDVQNMDRIILRRFRHATRILNPVDYEYYKTLRQKLRWSEQIVE